MSGDPGAPRGRGRPRRPAPGARSPDDAVAFAPDTERPLLERAFPVSRSLPGYAKRSLRADAIAGVTVAALALPSGMAYAQLAGLSPVVGLYALLLPAVVYAFLGTSRQLIVGPEAPLAMLTAGAIAPLAAGDSASAAELAALLALMTAAIYAVARLLRLGWIADYFSRPVLVGYMHGIAVILIIGQLEKLLGLSIDASDPLPQLAEALREIGSANGATVIVGLTSLAVVLVLRRVAPKAPASLFVVVGGIVVSYAADLASHGVATVGTIPSGLPSLAWPQAGASDALHLLPAALGVFAVGYADSILTARSFAGRNGEHVRANQELVALGAANLAAGVTQGFPVGASGSRTAVNAQVGGRTQIVGVVGAVTIAIVLLFLTEPVSYLPNVCLGAVIVAAAIGLIDPSAWRALAAAGRAEVVIAVVTMAGVIAVGLLEALVVAVALSIIDVVRRSSRPHDAVLGWVERLGRYADISLHPHAIVTPGVVVYRLDDRLIFANADYVAGRIREAIAGATTPTRWLVFDAEAVSGIDSSGIEMLGALVDELHNQGIAFVVARAKSILQRELDDAGFTQRLGAALFYPNVERAVRACVDAGRGSGDPSTEK